MGQLLIIHGEDPQETAALLRRSLQAFRTIAEVEPSGRIDCGATAVVKFPRRFKGSTSIAVHPASGEWVCGQGTWLLRDLPPQASLEVLAGRHGDERTSYDRHAADLDGSFVLAGGDPAGHGLWVATDRIGTLHAYLATIGRSSVVCTSSLVLRAITGSDWDPTSCAEFLATGTVFEDRTLFGGIGKLEPGSVYHFGEGRLVSRRRYWHIADLDYGPPAGRVESLATALVTSLESISRAFDRPLMDLTGGLDSRALLAAMLGGETDFDTVVNGVEDHPDVITANRLAGDFGLRHRHQGLPADWHDKSWGRARSALALCDGEYDILEYARVLESHRHAADAADAFDVSINGSGGEFAKGYWWELLWPRIGSTRHFDSRRLAGARFDTDRWSDGLCVAGPRGGLTQHFGEVIDRATGELDGHPNTAKMDAVYLALRMQRWQGRIASATNRLWPCVSPFMFRGPLEAALTAPPGVRVRNRMSRRLIELLNPRLAAAPLAQGYPALPLRLGTAHRFLPLATELLGKVTDRLARLAGVSSAKPVQTANPDLLALFREPEVREMLEPSEMRTRQLYDPGRLESFLSSVRTSASGNPSHIGRVLTLEYLARVLERAGS